MKASEHERDTGTEEYPWLYIAPPTPSANWGHHGRVRWTNIAIRGLLILVTLAAAGGLWMGLALLRQAVK